MCRIWVAPASGNEAQKIWLVLLHSITLQKHHGSNGNALLSGYLRKVTSEEIGLLKRFIYILRDWNWDNLNTEKIHKLNYNDLILQHMRPQHQQISKVNKFCQLNVFVNLQGKYEWISRSLLPLAHSSSPKLEPLAITILFVWHCCNLPSQRHFFQAVVHFVKTAGHRSRYLKNYYHAYRWNSITCLLYPHLRKFNFITALPQDCSSITLFERVFYPK